MDKFKNFCRSAWGRVKAYAVAAAAGFGLCTAANAQSGNTGYDIAVVTEVSTKLKDTLTNFWTDNKESILAVIGIIVVFTLIWLVVKLFKRSTSKA